MKRHLRHMLNGALFVLTFVGGIIAVFIVPVLMLAKANSERSWLWVVLLALYILLFAGIANVIRKCDEK